MRVAYRPLLTAAIVVGLLVGVAFGGGVVYGHNTAKPATPVAAAGGAGGAGAAAGRGGAGGAAAGGGGAGAQGGAANPLASQTIGTVTGVQADVITVRAVDGRTVQFATTLSSQISDAVPASASAIRPGQLVVANPGPPDAQGRTTASSILVLPASLAALLPPSGDEPSAGAGTRGQGGGARPAGTGTPGGTNPSATPARTAAP